jgi:DNA-3-methyladenine glycosylase I
MQDTVGPAGCTWPGSDPLYRRYHDTEWGVPVRDPRLLWEMLVLEGFQAGLSWITILRKRENFRRAFAGFDPAVIATWGEPDIARLLGDPGIVRHRGKIAGTITSARAWLAIPDFAAFVWDGIPAQVQTNLAPGVPPTVTSPQAIALSKRLRKAGFAFCGPTTVYAFMQAAGLVNDHVTTCPRHAEVQAGGQG